MVVVYYFFQLSKMFSYGEIVDQRNIFFFSALLGFELRACTCQAGTVPLELYPQPFYA
jgi:hypothetical protein